MHTMNPLNWPFYLKDALVVGFWRAVCLVRGHNYKLSHGDHGYEFCVRCVRTKSELEK